MPSKIEIIEKVETALSYIHQALGMIDEARDELLASGQDADAVDAYITATKQAIIDHIAFGAVEHQAEHPLQ